MDYKDRLIQKVYKLYLGDIDEDDLTEYFKKWAKKNNYPLPKMFKVISSNFAYNSPGDIVPILTEDEKNIYYNDGCHRYCYIEKSQEGIDFKYVTL